MLYAVYVVYDLKHKTYRDRIACNLLLSDAEELIRQNQGHGYRRVDLEGYPAWPFTARWTRDTNGAITPL